MSVDLVRDAPFEVGDVVSELNMGFEGLLPERQLLET
jgi:hypothetical protein